ncbi:MAG: DUF1214 domain-containing protein [Actinomycetota bacterium]
MTPWERFCDQLKEAGRFVADEGSDTAEGYRHLTRLLAMNLSSELENTDPTRPQLGWVFNQKMGQDNPDGRYQQAPIDTSRTYRLWGNLGSVRYLGLNIMTWTFGREPIRQLLLLNGDDLGADDDGNVEIHIGPDPRPDDHAGAWHQVEPVANCRLLVRQFFADWENERPAELHLECLDPDPAEPRLDESTLDERLGAVVASVALMGPYWHGFAQTYPVNEFHPPQDDAGALGGTGDQFYGQCQWTIEPGEALIFEATPPPCTYWGVQLGDRWYQSLDYIDRQSSLNDHQAVLDPDGVFRAVVAHEDPGFANWLDTGGCDGGSITYRWNQAEHDELARLRLVRLADLDAALPTSPRVTSEARAETLRRRRAGALARFAR